MDPSSPQHSTRSRRAVPATAIVAAVFVVLTAVTWVTGGLRASSSSPEQLRPGATVEQNLYTVQVISARTASMEVGLDDKPGPVLAVRMRVTNNGDRTTTISGGKLSGVTGGVLLGPQPGRRADDAVCDPALGATLSLQPRLPTNVDMIWKLTGPPPQQVTVGLQRWERWLTLDQDEYIWSVTDPTYIAQVTLPVRQGGTA
jgi:hypothetical protein